MWLVLDAELKSVVPVDCVMRALNSICRLNVARIEIVYYTPES